ncbi:Glycerone kinase [Beutenbergia cavernae DSM 12333]|uniref:Glycerone kinase n=1 Tax=Beutenbergia cavernae (strain ATCC BAA-8 / DSM 12333 / CCUG 43141 / JCM 11478 / NBRC 16432 / NCIMB 13614 / HKI 0122) TaxID=471853 RepID=C5C3A4_BEUC1|nr:dihydroxyacetone kinase family protein [Beutenbergia cavernae]ACQ79803.1 Glycerone kinase [Beutenbergia cavernae DSM 12333]
MTHLVNDPHSFASDVLDGFVAAHPDDVVRVHGGVVRATRTPQGQVAVVLGGGSGHYPAFAGWVGPGMAHGAVCGNVFASPSASQAVSVVRAAQAGGGVLLGFGNYAGDVLQFGEAARELRAAGIDVRIVTVTDDVASAPPERAEERRGIAGDLVVLKVAGAAAAAGYDLDDVERVTRMTNDRTRTIGVALSGCTLPGQVEPLFAVEPGTIALGLGIHGEPGLAAHALGTAAQVADELVDRLLAELPCDVGDRVAVLLNGLGSTTHEELFAVYGRVASRLCEAGLVAVRPEVGEHVTSLDMAGLSLTLTLLDPELETLWLAPVDAPALRRGAPAPAATGERRDARDVDRPEEVAVAEGTPESRRAAAVALDALAAVCRALREAETELGALDAVAGDGDHGQGMVLGAAGALAAGRAAHDSGAGLASVLRSCGAAWAEAAGGTSGALWGGALRAAADAFDDASAPDAAAVLVAVERAAEAVTAAGGASVGDKTMVDAVVPFVEALRSALGDAAPAAAWSTAAAAADRAAAGTADLVARRGRARTHGERGIGHRDPGAVSFALVMTAAGRVRGADLVEAAADARATED